MTHQYFSLFLQVTLKIRHGELQKAMRFSSELSIAELLKEIAETFDVSKEAKGLFHGSRWLSPNRTLSFYDLTNGVPSLSLVDDVIMTKQCFFQAELEFRSVLAPIRVKLMDESIKTLLVDLSASVADTIDRICQKCQLPNSEEYGLCASDGRWLDMSSNLSESTVVKENSVLILKKKFFCSDSNVDRSDPVQLHLLYTQVRTEHVMTSLMM